MTHPVEGTTNNFCNSLEKGLPPCGETLAPVGLVAAVSSPIFLIKAASVNPTDVSGHEVEDAETRDQRLIRMFSPEHFKEDSKRRAWSEIKKDLNKHLEDVDENSLPWKVFFSDAYLKLRFNGPETRGAQIFLRDKMEQVFSKCKLDKCDRIINNRRMLIGENSLKWANDVEDDEPGSDGY